jgi:putative MATE family efflux protein
VFFSRQLILFDASFLGTTRPDALLGGVLKDGAPARVFARPYLLVRGLAFLPSLVSLIGFSAFRGMMDTITPLKISLFANILNAILDPILIFKFKWGVTGAAVATLMSEVASAVIFITMMIKKNLIVPSKLKKKPKLERLAPLLKGGAALQLRNFALNLTFLAVTRVTQSIDETGVAAAAHAMAIQTFQIGGIVLLALSTVAQFVIPGEMVEKIGDDNVKRGGLIAAKACVNRLMSWGFVLGTILAALQIVMIPFLQKATPIEDVRKAAQIPSLLASIYQCFNGLVFIGEGVMVGTGSFMQLSISTMIATLGTLLALREFPSKFGLTGVWMSFGVFNTLRLAGVVYHQRYNGPLSDKRLKDDLTSSAN